MEAQQSIIYMNIIKAFGYSVSFIVMVFASYMFSIGNDESNHKMIPYLLTCCFFAFVVINGLINIIVIPTVTSKVTNEEKKQIKITFTDINCLVISWMVWMTYGVVFKDIYGSFGNLWILIQTLILFSMVIFSYIPQIMNNKIHMWTLTFVYSFIVVFFYSKDGISTKLSTLVLITKVVLFATLYIINDYKLQLPDTFFKDLGQRIYRQVDDEESDIEENSNVTVEIDIKEYMIRMKAITLVRSYWVLACWDRFVIASLFQIVFIATFNYCRYADLQKSKTKKLQKKTNQESPLQQSGEDNGESKKKKKKKGTSQKQEVVEDS